MHLHSVWLATFINTGSGTNLNGMTLRTWNAQKHTKQKLMWVFDRWKRVLLLQYSNRLSSYLVIIIHQTLTVLFTYTVVVFLQVTPSWLQQPLHLSGGKHQGKMMCMANNINIEQFHWKACIVNLWIWRTFFILGQINLNGDKHRR